MIVMKLVTNKSKNLLYRIVDGGNVIVQFTTSYAVATQRTSDSATVSKFKIVAYKGTDYYLLTDMLPVSSIGKFTRTFTTPSTTGYDRITFGLNGSKVDTMCNCNMDLKPSTTYTFTCNFTNITQGSISWKDMMLVEGSTVGDYEPYSYNLLDKWKYPVTTTTNGVTFTNNGDGSITANGTATATAGYILFNYQRTLTVGHKYLLSGAPSNASSDAYIQCYDDTNYEWLTDKGNGGIATFPKEIVNLSGSNMIRIRIGSGYNVNGLLFEPALYDLTLMYGAGNEPTTVNQFYTDHPELKVSPLGFIGLKNLEISNKNIKRLKCATTTKNLFDINKFGGVTSSISIDGNMLLSTIPSDDHGDIFAFKCTISVKKNTNYIISVQDHSYDIFSCYVYTDELWGNRVSFGSFPLKFNSGDNESLVIGFYSIGSRRQSNVATWIQGPQIEEGSTATSYVPYGYLDLGIIPSNSGYILDKYNNLSEELLEENVEKDNINYHIPDKTNISLNKVEGKTNKIVQIIDKSKFQSTQTVDGVTFTNNGNGTYTVNGKSTASGQQSSYTITSGGLTGDWLKGHKYLFYLSDKTDLNYSALIGGYSSFPWSELGYTVSSRNPLWEILTAKESSVNEACAFNLQVKSGVTCTNELASPQVFDLTAMYGFGKEPTTVEQFKKDYPQFFDEKLDGIWNVRTSGISSTGKNLFDISKWIISQYDVAHGTLVERLSNGAICQGDNGTGDGDGSYSNGWFRPMSYQYPNSIYLQAGTYTLSADYTMIENSVVNTANVNCYLYGDHNYTGSPTSVTVGNTVKVKNTYTVEEGYYYPIFTLNSGKVKIENIQIELNSAATTYEPYQENKIDLLSTQTLNGINGVNDYIEVIDKGNGLYDLKKTQNIASVDLGTLDWAIDGSNFSTYTLTSKIKPASANAESANCVCDKYVNCSVDKSFVDGDFAVNTTGHLYFRNSAYTTVAAFKTAVTGTMFYYQLKTPAVTTIATNLTYNQVSAIRTNGGLLLVNDNNNQKYVQPDVTLKENFQYKS